jgi:prophage maintenance system killer protein
MELHVDVPWILQVVEAARAGDPAPDDYGVPVAAIARHRAEVLEEPVYRGPYAKAAALVHTLGRCHWLEHSNLLVAAATGVMYLHAAGVDVKPSRDDVIALRNLLTDTQCTVAAIAGALKSWPVSG